jgi:hypothetical protein
MERARRVRQGLVALMLVKLVLVLVCISGSNSMGASMSSRMH